MDREIRQLEKDEDWQRLYAALNRAGRYDEGRELFLNHPISVDCIIQYRYDIHWSTPDWMSSYRMHIRCYDFNELIEKFIAEKVGASQIISITRNPVYRVLDTEIDTSFFTRGPLKSIAFTIEKLEEAKARIRSHPHYMRGATADQLQAAAEADSRDAIKAQRRIQAEREEFERQRVKQETVNSFEEDARQLKQEAWSLWNECYSLARPQFANAIKDFSARFILFKLKDLLDELEEENLVNPRTLNEHHDIIASFGQLWHNSYDKRFVIWKRNRKVAHHSGTLLNLL